MKLIKRRLASVTTTKKIMKAMNMVAASKLQKDRARLEAARPFYREAERAIHTLKTREDSAESIFFETREVKNTAYLVITSDRGLCGSYNSNLAEEALRHMNATASQTEASIVAIGQKGGDYFKRKGKAILQQFDDVMETAFYEDAERIGYFLSALYTSGEVDEVYVAYTRFESALTHVPHVERLLPLGPGAADSAEADNAEVGSDMQYEPDLFFYMEYAVPLYLSAFIYSALLEASTCEQAARMVSMDTAVKNASEIIAKLTRLYNRSRQAAITQEISEVVSSTNILK